MRLVASGSLIVGLVCLSAGASAAEEPRYTYCTATVPGKPQIPDQWNTTYPAYYSSILQISGRDQIQVVERQFAASAGTQYADCDHVYNAGTRLDDANENLADHLAKYTAYHVNTGWTGSFAPSGAAATAIARPVAPVAPVAPVVPVVPKKPKAPAYVDVADGKTGQKLRLSAEVAARNQAAAESYRREMEAFAQAKADHDRKLAEHQGSAGKAAAATQEHEAKLAANAAEVAAHKAAMDDYQKKLAGKASTDDDPDRCITSPETKPGLRGNTEVRVTNGCDQKVDIVICLKRTTGDWLCGANFGILSQRSMTFMSTNATGEIYVDAVTFGSGNKLGRPAGIIK